MSPAFLAQEWRGVVLGQDVTDLAGYLAAPRTGRGRRLPAGLNKETLWKIFSGFTDRLRRERSWTYETICIDAARLLAGRPRYRHVVVDEAQDLAPWQWRLVRAAVAPGPDDLFVAGDAHQRIYAHRSSLRSLGIDVTGRSQRLRISYRTTAEILGWSMGLLHGQRVDGLDADLETLAGCRADVHGAPPRLLAAPDRDTEQTRLADTVGGWLDEGVAAEQIGVAARTVHALRAAGDALAARGLPASVLGEQPRRENAVALATMHRMKGLEFRCVAVVGVSDGQVPHPAAVTPADEDAGLHTLELQQERCLLFVACTRAREQLVVSWHGEPSPFLAGAARSGE